MPTPLRRRLRLARRGLGYAAASVLVLVALVIGVASRLLPIAEAHPERIAEWLGERSGRPVAFDAVSTEWTRRGPLLRLEGLRVGERGREVEIGDAEMLVSMYAGLFPGTPFSELRLRGLDLTLERLGDGRWQVRGLPGQQHAAGGDPLGMLEGLGELQVVDGRLGVSAPDLGIQATVPRIDMRLRVEASRVRAGLRAWPATGAEPLDAALDLDRSLGNGRAWAGAEHADIAPWAGLLRVAGITVQEGTGRAEAWVELRRHRIRTADAVVDFRDVRLSGSTLDPAGIGDVPSLELPAVEARLHLGADAGQWRVDAPRLRLTDGEGPHVLDGLLVAGGKRIALVADSLDAGPLLSLAALSDRLPAERRRWILEARPSLRATGVEVAGSRGGPLRVEAVVASAGLAPAGAAPGLSGVSGRLRGDGDAIAFHPDPSAIVQVAWPREFDRVHRVALDGTLVGWREGDGWRLASRALAVVGDAYRFDVRGGLHFEGDGTRPAIALAAGVRADDLQAAKGFWLRNLMPQAAVAWLDDALEAGRVEDGRAIVAGDLDDWPFRADADGVARGLFRADARLVDARLRFDPGWPAAESIEATASFVADGFTVAGSGEIAGVAIPGFAAGIARYGRAPLRVTADASADASRLVALLRDSPLQREHGETLANIDAHGPARVDFSLQLPAGATGFPDRLQGQVALEDVSLRERRWDLAFDEVNGRAEFGGSGFAAEDLQVVHAGRPARLRLRAGEGFVETAGNAFEGALSASLEAGELIGRVPELSWLAPRVSGRSNWEASVALPRGAANRTPGSLMLRSDLVGTALALPAPLDKSATTPLAARVEMGLPLDAGEVAVRLGDAFALRARQAAGKTGIRVALGGDAAPPPGDGLVVTGTAPRLDALGWVGLLAGGTAGGPGQGGHDGPPLQRVDVTASRLVLLGGVFDDTRVRLAPAAGGALAVRADGVALQGALLVPAGKGAAVRGRFDRLHWNAPPAPEGGRPVDDGVGRAEATATSTDPAEIPPLELDIDDLRIRDARLGAASLRTRPGADGMRIDSFTTRARAHQVSVSGDWSGRRAAARSRLEATIESRDFGALLDGLGFGGRLDGGEGTATLQARWPGSPADFQLARLEGTLRLDARDGRLVEVEPGAGRVLGLLSIAELPRRLTLDFRDFFSKGFAFNTISGGIDFGGGVARSDGLAIDGPAAEIRIRGTADLRARTYDQTIEVQPRPGGLLTVVGAIAGGPVGAAIGAAANAVLQEPLGEVAERVYRVTGPWADPDVDVVERAASRGRSGTAAVDAQDTHPGPAPPADDG